MYSLLHYLTQPHHYGCHWFQSSDLRLKTVMSVMFADNTHFPQLSTTSKLLSHLIHTFQACPPPPTSPHPSLHVGCLDPPNSDIDCGFFNVQTDVSACNFTRGVWTPLESLHWKLRKIPCRTGESNLRRQCAVLMLYQLSYIPTYGCGSFWWSCLAVTVMFFIASFIDCPWWGSLS